MEDKSDLFSKLVDYEIELLEHELEKEIPLPKVLYHATKRGNRTRIENEGIKPSKLIFSDDLVVSLSDDPGYAISVVCKQHDIPPEKVDVWQIETMRLQKAKIRNYLRKENKEEINPLKAYAIHEVHYYGLIEPEWIALLKQQSKIA